MILVLADDLTGALEAGAKFASRDLKTRVTTKRTLPSEVHDDVLVIDTETRHLTESEAHSIVLNIALAARELSPQLIYKKTDSTLRGNIAAEFRALRTAFPDLPFGFAPAYEEMGRTVQDGHLYVWGKLLHETEFALDPLNPVRDSNIRRLIGDDSITILQGDWFSEQLFSLLAGPACLVDVIAGEPTEPRQWPRLSQCLVVNGSKHPVSAEQISVADTQRCFGDNWTFFEGILAGDGLNRAKEMGEQVRVSLSADRFHALVVFGGDTAFGIHSALGSPDFEPWGEILPGVPLSRCGGLFWITKAGGFGLPDLLYRLHKLLA